MTEILPFYPLPASTVNINAGTSSANVALVDRAGAEGTIRVVNPSIINIFIEFGTSSSVAASLTTSILMPPGAMELFRLPQNVTYVAAITASSTGYIYFTPGKGS